MNDVKPTWNSEVRNLKRDQKDESNTVSRKEVSSLITINRLHQITTSTSCKPTSTFTLGIISAPDPADVWTVGDVIPIIKPGKANDQRNYHRPICIESRHSKNK